MKQLKARVIAFFSAAALGGLTLTWSEGCNPRGLDDYLDCRDEADTCIYPNVCVTRNGDGTGRLFCSRMCETDEDCPALVGSLAEVEGVEPRCLTIAVDTAEEEQVCVLVPTGESCPEEEFMTTVGVLADQLVCMLIEL